MMMMMMLMMMLMTGISVLLNRMQWPENSVAIDGSLYRYHPKLHSMMMAWIAELAPNTKVYYYLLLYSHCSGEVLETPSDERWRRRIEAPSELRVFRRSGKALWAGSGVEPWPEMHFGIFWRRLQYTHFAPIYMHVLWVRETVFCVTLGGGQMPPASS